MEWKKEAALRPREHGRACLGARLRERDEGRVRAHAGVKTIDGGRNGCGDEATGTRTKRDGRLVSCARGDDNCGTCRKTSQHGTKVVLHTAASVAARGDGELPRIDTRS
jgi:hypothetical protein